MAKKTEKVQLPTLAESNPANPYKRFLALGSVLANHLETVTEGDAVGIVYLGMVQRAGAPDYHNFQVKVQRHVTSDRLTMKELLTLKAEDIQLYSDEPLIGVVVEVGEFTTEYGKVRSYTVCTDLDNIHPEYHEPAF